MEAFHRIETWTRALQRAASRHAWWEAACTTTLLLSAGLAGALAVAAWTGPGWGRWAWASVALATGAAVRAWWRGWWRDDLRRDAIAVARFAEARLPDMESGIVTALECSALLRDDRSGSWPRPSQALVEASVERTWTRLQGVKAEQLVDGSRLLKLRNATLLALALWGLVATAAPSWIEAGLHGLTATAPSDGEAVSIELALRDLTLELRPPEYLHRDTRTLKGTRGDVSTIAGTTVVVSGHPTVPTERAELLLDFARTHRLPMTMATDGRFSASFVAKESGRYRIALLPGEGERVEETQGRILDIRPDVLPSVRMLRPETDLEVRAGDPISMAYEASDDHGVAEIALWIDGPVGGAERRVLRRGVRDSVLKGVDEIGVASLGLSPGESAELWLEVVDGNDVSGPGVGRSRRVRIWLFSPEMEHARRLSDLESLIEAMIGLLADRLESPIRDEKPERIIEAVIWHQAIVTMAAQLIESVENLIGALNTDTLASESLRALLTETLTTLQSHRTQEDAMLRRAVLANSQHKQPRVLQRLIHQANDEATGDLERTIFALKDELERSRQDRVLEEGRDLLDAQESLRELMAQLKEGEVDPALMEEAERRIDQLEASLARRARELDQLAERAPYENQNPATRPSETQ